MRTTHFCAAGMLLSGICAAAASGQYTGGGIPILDAFDEISPITVSDLSTVSSVRLTIFGLTHGRAGDLRMLVTHTDSQNVRLDVELCFNAGATPANPVGSLASLSGDYGFTDTAATTFWDAAVATGSGVVPNGDYHPSATFNGTTDPLTFLSSFNGDTAAGRWSLSISDSDPGFQGSISGWQLDINGVPEPAMLAPAILGIAILPRRRRRR
jgi:hypothetical protein